MKRPLAALLFLAALLSAGLHAQETIVMIRHGEKTPAERGQLNCMGLNRSLALPAILLSRYGRPDFIFAPDPAVQIGSKQEPGQKYSYVRPLATIEPTAVQAGLPVNTQIGFNRGRQLVEELRKPMYAHSLIFVAWEHGVLHDVAQQLMTAYGNKSDEIAPWPGDDFDTIYVFRIASDGPGPRISFHSEREGLDGKLSASCPSN
jgi:hypothetical protein